MSIKIKAKAIVNGDAIVRVLRLPQIKDCDLMLDVAIEIHYGEAVIEVEHLEAAASMLQELAKEPAEGKGESR